MRHLLPIVLLLLTTPLSAQNWPQWGASAQHESATPVVARRIDRIEQEIVIDPLAGAIEDLSGAGELLAHYPVPLIDGDDVVLLRKSGSLSDFSTRETQVWNVADMRRVNGLLTTHWLHASDWKPVPFGNPSWEPVYHPAIGAGAVWAPGAGGTIDKLDRETGALIKRFNPFGTTVDPTIFVCGPPVIDQSGNIYYNAIQLNTNAPWSSDSPNAWLVRIDANGNISKATFTSLTPNAPAATDQCLGVFDSSQLPWPPSPTAMPPMFRCGSQRPGINVAPAIAADGTIYTISRAHLNSRYGFLVAVNSNMTPRWSASLRNRLNDGCDVTIPPSGTLGGCRAGAIFGVDPADNQPPSGAVNDNSTASPVVLPDGSILYGAYTRYNYSQGHLMMFRDGGQYMGAYPWGWDLTPAVYRHDGTWSVVLKENHYAASSYCDDPNFCPFDRTANTPSDPEVYFITQLNSSLQPEWKFESSNSLSCQRKPNGTLDCIADHPLGFEWCVNAVAVDARGVVYADSEDGNLYAIAQGGKLEQRIFLRLALGAAYTATSIGPDGRVYTQNDGDLFVINQDSKSRAVRRR
jgi:outer membrane protein assembly factor BamB